MLLTILLGSMIRRCTLRWHRNWLQPYIQGLGAYVVGSGRHDDDWGLHWINIYRYFTYSFCFCFYSDTCYNVYTGDDDSNIFSGQIVKKGSRLAYIMLLTMALALLLQNTAMIVWGSQTFYFPSIFPNTSAIQLTHDVFIAPEQILIIAVAIIMMMGLVFF